MRSEPSQDAAARPLMIYDGDCGFCRFWIARWHAAVGDRIDFAPAQEVASRFPDIPPEKFARSVQLVLPDGTAIEGAHAVLRALAFLPRKNRMLWAYRHVPGVAPVSEFAYRLIAGHRSFFSKLTTLVWGRQPEPPTHYLTRWLFLRLLGAIYLIAFLSFAVQATGLVGAHGILPASRLMQTLTGELGPERYRLFPTLTWLSSSDAFLKFLCWGGAGFSLLVILCIAPGPALVLTWGFYLSLVTVGRDFMSFQWDILLLEAGFLAIFFASWRPFAAPWSAGDSPPSRTVLLLLRWLLFRLLFLSGAVKLASGDPTWRSLSALDYHYWTQPLPTPPAWYMAQLPSWFQHASVVGVFFLELVVPLFIFAPRRLRFAAAGLSIGFQCLIGFTGNYAFFNLLAIALCVLLFDDAALRRLFPQRIRERLYAPLEAPRLTPVRRWAITALAVVVLPLGLVRMASTLGEGGLIPRFARQASDWIAPFYLANSYGLFAVMTTQRVEIQVEGSDDGETWLPYAFRYKPGDVRREPRWVEPHQPRLDWQMWFAALSSYRQNPWFVNFMVRLLEGSPEVLRLLASNPFPTHPPRYIRALAYEYRFTDFAKRRATGAWWQRERAGLYFPVVSLRR